MNQLVSIGDRLREERQRLDINQTQFGELGGVTKKTQMLYESGERFPDAAYLAAIAAAGADVRYIITGDREGPVPDVLTSDERLMLDRYRASPQPLRDAALRVLLGESPKQKGQVFNAEVGQAIKTKTLKQPNLSFFSGEKQKKK